jgi:demethylmenaquinone methyltransferase/2-methoxy-6-polyprenyl-1,4-benzoquinol methylase
MWRGNSISSQPMSKFAHDEVVPYQHSQLDKKEQVADMFNSIAYRYDFMNRFLARVLMFGGAKKRSASYKTVAEKNTGCCHRNRRCGHHDLPDAATEKITGIDISEGMLELGRKKIEKLGLAGQIELQKGDSEVIRFEDNSFDAITVAFGVRNFQNLDKGLKEMYRVLQPGGKLVVLEFSNQRMVEFYRA